MNSFSLRVYRVLFYFFMIITVFTVLFSFIAVIQDCINRLQGVPETGWATIGFLFGALPAIALLTLIDFTLWGKINTRSQKK